MEESNRDGQTQVEEQFFEGECRWTSQKI